MYSSWSFLVCPLSCKVGDGDSIISASLIVFAILSATAHVNHRYKLAVYLKQFTAYTRVL